MGWNPLRRLGPRHPRPEQRPPQLREVLAVVAVNDDDTDPYAGLTRDDIRATWLAYSANRLRFKRELERVWSNTSVSEAAILQHKADLQVNIAACDIEMEALEQAYRNAQPEPVEPVARERAS